MMRFVVLLTLVAVGCAAEPYPGTLADRSAPSGPAKYEAPAAIQPTEAESGDQALPSEGALQRKIIYTADIDLVVENFDPIPEKVEALAKRFGGFVANSNVSGSPGHPRSGQWTLRIPAERYDEFLPAARELGEVQRVSVDSQDVTEEFYDVEARIRNKEKAEERLLQLLEDATGELKDVLEIERELTRVREEIERVKGRRRVLNDLTSLTTINLSVQEIKDYVPEEAATYATRVRRGFQASIAALVSTAENVSIALIVLSPWLGVLLVLALVLGLVWRVIWRRRMRVLERRVELVEERPPPG